MFTGIESRSPILSSSSLFNSSSGPLTDVNGQTGYSITSSLATAITFPSTNGFIYVVNSIHIVNLGIANDSLTCVCTVNGVTSYLNLKTPMNMNTILECLTRIKVFYPGDTIQFQAQNNDSLYAIITYSRYRSNTIFGVGTVCASSLTDVFTSTNSASTIESIYAVNIDDTGTPTDHWVSIYWTDNSNNIKGYYSYQFDIIANSVAEIIKGPKRLEISDKIRAYASTGASISLMIAGEFTNNFLS